MIKRIKEKSIRISFIRNKAKTIIDKGINIKINLNIKMMMKIAINMMRKMVPNNSLIWMMITNYLSKKSIRNLFWLNKKKKNIMFQVLAPKSNRIEMKLGLLNKETIEIINRQEIKEFKDLNLLKIFEVLTAFSLFQ